MWELASNAVESSFLLKSWVKNVFKVVLTCFMCCYGSLSLTDAICSWSSLGAALALVFSLRAVSVASQGKTLQVLACNIMSDTWAIDCREKVWEVSTCFWTLLWHQSISLTFKEQHLNLLLTLPCHQSSGFWVLNSCAPLGSCSVLKCVLGLALFEEGRSCCMFFRTKHSLASCKRGAGGWLRCCWRSCKNQNCVSW